MKVKLLSSDGVLFEVDESTASRSGVIRTVLVDVGNKDPIPLLNVKSHVLTKVLEYCEHHRNEPLPPLDVEYSISPSLDIMRRKNTHISGWDQQYMKCEQELLFEVVQAASYLDIQSLLDLGCRTVANMMTGKSVDDIRQLFHIENDFTPEEELAMQVERSELESLCNMLGFSLDPPANKQIGKGKAIKSRPNNSKAPAPPAIQQLSSAGVQSMIESRLGTVMEGEQDTYAALRKMAKRRINELQQQQRGTQQRGFR